jgi:hypothetical protein
MSDRDAAEVAAGEHDAELLRRRLDRLRVIREVYGLTGRDEAEYRRLRQLADVAWPAVSAP